MAKLSAQRIHNLRDLQPVVYRTVIDICVGSLNFSVLKNMSLLEIWNDISNSESLVIKTGNFKVIEDHETTRRLQNLCDIVWLMPPTANEREQMAFYSRSHVVYYTIPFLFKPRLSWQTAPEPQPEARGSVNWSSLRSLGPINFEVTGSPKPLLQELIRKFHVKLATRFANLNDKERLHWCTTIRNIFLWNPTERFFGNEDKATCRSRFEATVWKPNQEIFRMAGYKLNFHSLPDEPGLPDLVVKDETGRCITTVKMWDACLSKVINDNGTLKTDHPSFNAIMRDSFISCLKQRCDMFFISCYTDTIVVQLDLERVAQLGVQSGFERRPDPDIMVKCSLINIEDQYYTLQSAIAAVVYRRLDPTFKWEFLFDRD